MKKPITTVEAGRLGGLKSAELAGSEGMAERGAKGREVLRKKDPDFYNRLSQAGLKAREDKKKRKRSVVSVMTELLTGE